MTTEEELKALQDEYDNLNIDYNRYQKAIEIQNKLKELRMTHIHTSGVSEVYRRARQLC